MCHPTALAALGLLVLNDHLLKALEPGPITGKLSDVAGLVYFPLLLVSAIERLLAGVPWRWPNRTLLMAAAATVTGASFAAVKLVPAATDAYNWVLGVAQWVVAAGPLTGAAPVPTTGVTDPSDLIAVPALGVALWLGRMGRRPEPASRLPARSAVRLAILTFAGLASIATSQPMQSASTSYEEVITLAADRSAAVRHLSLAVDNRDTVNRMGLLAEAYSEWTEDGMRMRDVTPGVIVSLAADPPTPDIVADYDTYFVPAALDIIELCRRGCSHGLWVIIRLADPPSLPVGEEVRTTLSVSVSASGGPGSKPLDMDLQLTSDADMAIDATPRALTVGTSGSGRVSSEREQARQRITISLDADRLAGPLAFPLLAEISMRAETVAASDNPYAHSTHFALKSDNLAPDLEWRYSFFGDEVRPTVIDLFPLCRAGERCVIEATIDFRYDATLNSPDFDPANAPPGFVELRWFLSVRLEAYDGRSLPADVLTISEVR